MLRITNKTFQFSQKCMAPPQSIGKFWEDPLVAAFVAMPQQLMGFTEPIPKPG